ncbi:MAG: hypothetical protein ACLTC4_06865 [Hungatella hathewayi]|uniref:Uncharacterized protein n=1 Tax=Hungatella hathewayi WAL-18680 TaxID=742737 RepID=G5ID95_9FIRM|nr:hypothetical protein [Hungatella hathewayi]EHI60542.1 hypothetical protein HMPREF9473_01472 [ [Hungatella hathewayi WAL-18680]MBS4983364.1 hypothetical protein [Hungatella hathewayi]
MDIYELINEMVQCRDIPVAVDKLLEFVDAALADENKEEVVGTFYQNVLDETLMDYIESAGDGGYEVYTGDDAAGKYLALTLPPLGTPFRTLQKIKKSAEFTKKYVCAPIGRGITEERVREIMEYMNHEYRFTELVFGGKKAMICLLDYSHTGYDSEFLTMADEDGMSHHMIMFHMNNCTNVNPEAVFFHELGHALHARYTGNLNRIPEDIVGILKDTCMPKISSLKDAEKMEVIADVLGMGLMYESGFEKYDGFPEIQKHDKAFFHDMVVRMFELINEQVLGV